MYIDSSVVCNDVSYVPGIISNQIGQKTNTFCSIVFHSRGNESWESKLPVLDDLGTVFPAYGLPEINVEVSEVKKSSVNSLRSHHCRFDDHICCIT